MIFFILDDTQVETVDINKDNFPQLYKAEDKNIKKKQALQNWSEQTSTQLIKIKEKNRVLQSDANEEGAGLMSCYTVGHQGANDKLQNVPLKILHTFT